MSYTAHHAEQNRQMRAAAVTALREVGWMPEPEPRNWPDLAENATYIVLAKSDAFITFARARHQVIAVMMDYRGRPGEWTK